VLVTLGKEGMAAEVNGASFLIPAPKVKVRDATGSGDVVTAALIYGEIQGWAMGKTFLAAVCAGAWNAADGRMGKVAKRSLRD
jgi:fructose-1-phosphate kinase PfkB-like protein